MPTLIRLKQIDQLEVSGFVTAISSGIANSIENSASGVLYSQMTGASGQLHSLIDSSSGLLRQGINQAGSGAVSGMGSFNIRLVPNTQGSGISFNQTFSSVPNIVSHIWTTGGGDNIIPFIARQFTTGVTINYSDTIPDNFYFINIIAKV